MNIDIITQNESVIDVTEVEKGYQVTIGRNIIRVVSVFSGTKTASKAIHEAAVKKILYDRMAG